MEQRIEFIETTESSQIIVLPDRFSFRSDKGHKWIQKVCIWALKKIGAYAQEDRITYTRHVIEPESFMENLWTQHGELCRRFGKGGARLLIGSHDFAELMASPEIGRDMMFHAEYYRADNGGKRICGLQVEIIPWMRGILVMP